MPTASPMTASLTHRRRWTSAAAVIATSTVIGATLAAFASSQAGASADVSMYSASARPAVSADSDPNSVELGVRFTNTVAGTITGVRYFKSSANTGRHTGSLWSAKGARLAEATFAKDSGSGWKTVMFARPVAASAGSTFVASYHASNGRYSTTSGAFANQATIGNGYLKGTAGLYSYGNGQFPRSSWDNTSYLVDVLFRPAGPVTPPVTTTHPAPAPVTTPPVGAPPVSTPPAPKPTPTGGKPGPIGIPIPAPPVSTPPSSSAHCMSSPSACGFPDNSNTGVPAGTALTPSGDLSLTTPGEVVSGLNITGCVYIGASNVTLKNSVIHGDCPGSAVVYVAYSDVSNVVIDHVDIDGGNTNPSSPGIIGAGYTVSFANIHGTGDGVDIQNNDHVLNSYIHGLHVAPGDHTDGLQSAGGTNSTVVHNTIDATCDSCNSAMIIGADLGNIGTFSANNNLVDGGGFTMYAGTGGYDSGSMTFANNRVGSDYSYGACSFRPSLGRSITMVGNVWDSNSTSLDC